MSALRFSRPGIAGTTLIDLGPDVTHPSKMRMYLLSDATVTRTLSPGQPTGVDRPIKRNPYTGPRCGYLMPKVGLPCFRRPHTDNDHRHEARVRADSDRGRVR